jgi:periplasmic protein TonB
VSVYALSEELWQISERADRQFRRLLVGIGLPAILLAIAISLLQLAGVEKGGGELEATRYAQLLPEQPPAPVAQKIEEPKPEEAKPETKPQPKPVPKKEAVPLTPEQIQEQARKVAAKQLAKVADALAELRDQNLTALESTTPLQSSVLTARSGAGGDTSSFVASAEQASQGIGDNASSITNTQTGTGLGTRRTTTVSGPKGFGPDKTRPGQSGRDLIAGRTIDELQLVFDRNKGALYTIFNRALRDNPSLRGKMVLDITIAPDGSVSKLNLVSSELGDADLEQKILSRIRMINFGAKAVPPFNYPNYPIVFQPG